MCCQLCFFFQAEDGIRDYKVTGVQTCALPICEHNWICFHAAGIHRLLDQFARVRCVDAVSAETWDLKIGDQFAYPFHTIVCRCMSISSNEACNSAITRNCFALWLALA